MAVLNTVLRRAGWVEAVIPFTGYGTDAQVRVLARVVLSPDEPRTSLGQAANDFLDQRGWRAFFAAPIPNTAVGITLGSSHLDLQTDRNGYVDVRLTNDGALPPGWGTVTVATPTSQPVDVPVQVVDPQQDFGIVSDIDDTVISTDMPRLFLAAYNSFVRAENQRQAVPGMADLYRRLLEAHPGAPTIYVSTGAWNTFPFLSRFLERHGFPRGAMLLTDWGPTNTGWFRSGPEHKRRALRELARDLPGIQWILVGDDGQHDPALYYEFSELQPDRVRAVAIRELSGHEQFLAHGTRTPLVGRGVVEWTPDMAPEVGGHDGHVLATELGKVLGPDFSGEPKGAAEPKGADTGDGNRVGAPA